MSRPILPVPPIGETPSHQTDSPRPPSISPAGEQQKRQYTKRGAISKIACRSCRRRKTKCNSERPTCQNCAARSEPCIYDFDESDRSLTFLRDNVENLAEERNALESTLLALQRDSEEAAVDIFKRIRTGANVHTLAQQVHASRVLTEVGKDNSFNGPSSTLSKLDQYEQLVRAMTSCTQGELDEIVRRLRVKVEPAPVLAAIRGKSLLQPLRSAETSESTPTIEGEYSERQQFGLVKGSAQHLSYSQSVDSDFGENSAPYSNQSWTSVTSDPNFIAHLFRIYFSWQHTFFQNFPEDLFRQDYATGQTRYCSKLLVNAICACGCLLSCRQEVRQDLYDFEAAGQRFYEAARLDSYEARGPSICTVAALALLSQFESTRGHVSTMWTYCGQSGRMALELSLHLRDDKSVKAPSEEEKVDEDAYIHTFWGCFIADQVTSFTLGRLPQIPVNAITTRRPIVDPSIDAKAWIAYFDSSDGVAPGLCSSTFKEVVSLCVIVNSTLNLFFNPARTISGPLLLGEYRKYLRWKESLPSILSGAGRAPPHVLCAHLLWHAAVLLLFRPFLRAKLTDSEVSPQDVCRQSANAISELFARHRSLYELTGIYAFQIQCLLTACTIHIIHIPAIASTTHFVDACKSLHDMAERSRWAKNGLDEINRLVKKWDRVLPGEAEAALYRDDRMSTDSDMPPVSATFQCSNNPQSFSRPLEAHEFSEKRTAGSLPGPPIHLPKRPRLSGQRAPQLFAPSASQPAPLLWPPSTIADAEESGAVPVQFQGLDFSDDNMFDPFMGFGANWQSVGSAN